MVSHPKIVKKMAECFKALGDPTRLMIIKLLASNMKDKICVVDLAKILGITQPAASQHIKILRNVGLLEPKKEGYHVYYYINKDVLRKYKKDFNLLYDLAFQKCKNYPDCRVYKK